MFFVYAQRVELYAEGMYALGNLGHASLPFPRTRACHSQNSNTFSTNHDLYVIPYGTIYTFRTEIYLALSCYDIPSKKP